MSEPDDDDWVRFDLEDYKDLDTKESLNMMMIMRDPQVIHEMYFGRLDHTMYQGIIRYKDLV